MVNSIIASLALFGASASAMSVGSARVINKCSYDVFTCVVPAEGGGQEQKDLTLAPGDEWNQEWTQLTNGAGWSIKFSHDEGSFGHNILQYEYTFQNDGNIWYDLSCVDGNPWDKNWEITSSTDDCNPKQQAYRFATDDAYGMQHCNQDASITVTLCSGEDSSNSTDTESSTPPSQPTGNVVVPIVPIVPTTLATITSSAPTDGYAVTVTKYVTAYAVAGANEKRHQHHPHGHNA